MHAERLRQGKHLIQGRVGLFSCPDLLDVFLGQVSQAYSGYLGVRVGSSRRLVLYGVEELVRLFGDANVPGQGDDGCPVLEAKTLLKPQFRRKSHNLGYGFQLLETRVFDPALPQVGDVRARHDATCRLIDLLAAPPASIGTTVHLQEALELLRDVHLSLPPLPRLSFSLIYDTILCIV